MSPVTPPVRRSAAQDRTQWASVAFVVEAMVLLLFLVASLAVLTKIFSASLNSSVESRTLDAATIAASSIAEHFAADPSSAEGETYLGDLRITCEVSEETRLSGTMYSAHIAVYEAAKPDGQPVYSIDTASYASDQHSQVGSA